MTTPTSPRYDALLSIKAAPPRPRRWWVQRERLLARFADLRDRPLVAVQAPAGFGKTSLLASLRRGWLASGAYVSWLTLDKDDEPGRFAEGLLLSLAGTIRNSEGLAALCRELTTGAAPVEIIGRLISLLAELAHPVVMIFDDLHTLPETVAAELLPYIALNLPANAHVLVGTRHALPEASLAFFRRGDLAQLDQNDLRFRLEESLELLRARFGAEIDADTGARVHDAVDGWPLGLQLAISIAERSDAPVPALARMGEHAADLHLHAAEAMLTALEPATLDFLVAVVALDRLHPELCVLLSGREDAPSLLARLNNETPVLQAAEGLDWYRMHAICRHALRPRFEALPAGRRKTLHWRAAQWLHQHQLLDEAADHALAAERSATAYEWIGRGLHDMVLSAQFAPAMRMLERLPADTLTRRPELGLAAAIANTLTYQHEAAWQQLEALAVVELSDAQRFELSQVRAALAHYCDDYGTIAELAKTMGEVPEGTDTAIRAANINMRTGLALHRGNTAAARFELRLHRWPGANQPLDYGQCYSQFFRAYTDWLDGRVVAAEAHLAPHRQSIEARYGRRSPPASLHASLHAAVLWDRGRPDEAEAMLADRLDVIERTGSPIAIALAYRTLIRAARLRGARTRVDELIGNLIELGTRRLLPRLVFTALDEQLRVDTATGRGNAAALTLQRLERYRRDTEVIDLHGLAPRFDLGLLLATARAALGRNDDDTAASALEMVSALLGDPAWPMRDQLEFQVLEVVLAKRRKQLYADALTSLTEIAAELGWQRLFADAWPELLLAAASPLPTTAPAKPGPVSAIRSVLLTDKENEVLAMLARNYTNKEIARALDIGDETAKWHVKNIASKLNAGGRRHTVERARLLGLLTTDGDSSR